MLTVDVSPSVRVSMDPPMDSRASSIWSPGSCSLPPVRSTLAVIDARPTLSTGSYAPPALTTSCIRNSGRSWSSTTKSCSPLSIVARVTGGTTTSRSSEALIFWYFLSAASSTAGRSIAAASVSSAARVKWVRIRFMFIAPNAPRSACRSGSPCIRRWSSSPRGTCVRPRVPVRASRPRSAPPHRRGRASRRGSFRTGRAPRRAPGCSPGCG